MSSIKVVNVNEEVKQEAVEEPVAIEEATEQIEPTNEVVDTPVVQSTSAGFVQGTNPPETEEVNEEVEEVVEKPKAKAKPKASDKVNCKTCDKSMSYKNYRYRHEKICSEEPKPVKPQANPKGKSKPKAQPVVKEVYEEEVEEEQPKPKPKLSAPVSNQILKPQTPNLVDFASHYQLLQNQFIQQKKEKYNNLCQNMFAPKSKKR